MNDFKLLLPANRVSGRYCFYTCLSVHGEGREVLWCHFLLWCHFPKQHLRPGQHLPLPHGHHISPSGQQAGGRHPNAMPSCWKYYVELILCFSFCHFVAIFIPYAQTARITIQNYNNCCGVRSNDRVEQNTNILTILNSMIL